MMFWIIQTWCVVGILMLLLSLLKRSRKVSPALLHALWVIVLLKSLAPPLVAWPYNLPSWSNIQTSSVANSELSPALPIGLSPTAATKPIDYSSVEPITVESSILAPAIVPSPIEKAVYSAPKTQSAQSNPIVKWPSINWTLVQCIVLCVWVAGGIATLAIELFRIVKLHRVLRVGASDAAIEFEVETVAKRLGMKSIPHRVVRGLTTPLIWSVGSPVLIWPAELSGLTTEARRGLIAHELAHVKRRDHWIAWLELASKVLWWWNPLQVALRRNLRDAADQACDAYVVNSLEIPRRVYAETLLSICETQSQATAPLASLSAMQSDKRGLEIRLRKLMSKTSTYKLSNLAIAFVAMIGVVIFPVWSQQPPTSPKSKPQSELVKNRAAAKQEKAQPKWQHVESDVKQEELPTGWPIPWIYEVVSQEGAGSLSVSGKVVDVLQRPVSHAIVALTFFDSIYGLARTNSSGEFKFERLSVPAEIIGFVSLTATHPTIGYGRSGVGHKHGVPLKSFRETKREEAFSDQTIELVKFRDLQGTAKDPHGNPVADAELSFTDFLSGYSREAQVHQFAPSTKSDRQGKFNIRNAPQVSFNGLEVWHKDWPSLLVNLNAPEGPIECKFHAGVRLSGRVAFPENTQNPEGQIAVFSTRFGQPLDSTGRFDFQLDRRLVGKTIMLHCFAKSDNHSLLCGSSSLEVGETANELEIEMQIMRAITGTVRARDGKELTNCTFRWRSLEPDKEEMVQTAALNADFEEIGYPTSGFDSVGGLDSDGTFRCNVSPKAGELIVSYSYAPRIHPESGMLLPAPRLPYKHVVAVQAGTSDLVLDIDIPGPQPREFVVHDAQGKPVKSGDLTLAWTEWAPRKLADNSVISDAVSKTMTVKIANGQATTALPERDSLNGTWIGVLAESEDGLFGWTTMNDESKSPIDVVVEKPIGWITGRTIMDRKRLADVPVQLLISVTRSSQPSVSLPPVSATSDVNGEYRLPNIAPLSGYVLAGIPNGLIREGSGVEINLNPGQSLKVEDINFMRPHGSIAGRILTPDGEPLTGVEVHIKRSQYTSPMNDGLYWANDIAHVRPQFVPYSWMRSYGDIVGNVCAAISDADGNFVFPNLPKGRLYLYVVRFSGGVPDVPLEHVLVEVGNQDVKLECPPPAPLNVWLQSADGPVQPVHSGYREPTLLPQGYGPVPSANGPRDASLPTTQPLPLPK